MVSVAATQPCHAAQELPQTIHKQTRVLVPVTLSLQKQAAGWIWPLGHNLPTLVYELSKGRTLSLWFAGESPVTLVLGEIYKLC